MVAAGDIDADEAQLVLARQLDRLCAAITGRSPGLIARLAGRKRQPVRGIYIYGDVGRGKTMLMDAFFAVAPVENKRRLHFNAFMSEVQDRLHIARSEGASDPIEPVAGAIVAEAQLLCLDEVAVTDIADAMILARLFAALFDRGLVLAATSNSAPEDLYREGLNRKLFLPFVKLLTERTDVVRLAGAVDYRMAKLAGTPVYIVPADGKARAALDDIWLKLTGKARGTPAALRTRGRQIAVPEASDDIARFSFADLCRAPLSAHDFLQIARAYQTVIVDGIEVIEAADRNTARRLILMVDTFYDHRVKLIASAETAPEGLYTAEQGEAAAAFKRTVSRLIEMQSGPYLATAHGLVASHSEAGQPLPA
jgi:cell division protein ZapE